MSELSSLVQTRGHAAGDQRLPNGRILGRSAVLGLAFWAAQLLAAGIHSGFEFRRISWVGCALAVALGLSIMAGKRIEAGSVRQSILGAWVGGGLGFVHLMTLAAIAGAGGIAPVWLGFALVIAVSAGLVLGWSGKLLRVRMASWIAVAVGLSGFALIHFVGLVAVGAAGPSWFAVGAAGVGFVASAMLLVGARLGDLSVLASADAVGWRERFRVLVEALPIPVVLATADNERVIFANERSRQQFFVPPGAAGERAWTDGFYADLSDRGRLVEAIRRGGAVAGQEVEMRREDGSTFWALTAARDIEFNGEKAILTGYYDITDRKAAEEALLDSEVRYALISRAANDGIWDWDIPSGTVYYSTRWREIIGAEAGKRFTTLEDWFGRVHPDDLPQLRRAIDDHVAGQTSQLDVEYRIRHGDGRYCWMQCRGIVLRGNNREPVRMAGSQSDITLRKTYEINLRNAAYEDRLTGINNRAFFTHLIDTRNNARAMGGTAILLFNVDQFSRINDSLGSGAGDVLLIAIARRLAARIKPQDALARLGGDEFAIWLQDVRDHQTALKIAEAMLGDLAQPYALGEVQMPVTISVGIAVPTLGGAETGGDLFRNTRLALDRAKQMGGGQCALFDDVLLSETKLRQRLSRDLTSAERLGQIHFVYQPVVALGAGGINTISGFEALMRWTHPDLGAISPVQFIPLAEEAGLIGPLGAFAIESAAREIARWTEAGLVPSVFSVAVNLSVRQISDHAGITRLNALLDRLALPPGRLKLEITESVLMSDSEAMVTTFNGLRRRGVELSLDDFGTGYSSLSYLHRFPLDVLKIDQSFISRMCQAPEAMRLVRSIVELAHDLGLTVVAEGVETAEEVDRLRGLGCDFAQGYFFSQPVSADRAALLLKRRTI